MQNNPDVYDYWEFFDGTYPRLPDLNKRASETKITKRESQQTALDKEARKAHHFLKKTIHQDQWRNIIKT